MNACPRLCPFYLYSLFLSILYIFHRLAVIILSESPLAQFSPDMVAYGRTQFVIANHFTESRATCNVMRHVSPVCSQGALSFFAQKLVIANYNLERRTSHQTTSFHPALGTGPSGAVDLVTVSRRDRYKPVRLLSGELEQLEIFLISRLPRLLAILCTGVGMSVAGLIMQQLCMNKFVSPTTGATISSAQFGILLALLFLPNSTLWGRALFAFAFAILGTWTFVWFIQRIQFKDVVMVPLVGIMFGNVIGGLTNYLAYQYEMTQALSTWTVGHFSMVLQRPV
ncbi:MAG: iron chelate uptake ABC transporter family permease subunit [Flavonifractor plautii]